MGFAQASFVIAQSAQAPKIVCEQPSHNFGETNNETTVSNVFVIQNQGDAPLNIRRVRSSCGCTMAQISTNILAPGLSAELSVAFNLRGRNGRQRKWVTIESDDPKTPFFNVEMAGAATTPIMIEPRAIHFGQRSEEEKTSERWITLCASSGVYFNITSWSLDSKEYAARIETNRPGIEYRLFVRPMATKMGRHATIAQIRTDHPAYGRISIPISDALVSDLAAVPQKVVLLASETNSFHARAITVSSRTGRPFALTDALMPVEECRYRIERVEDAKWRLILEYMPVSPELHAAEIKLSFDRPGAEALAIPIVFQAE